jgi:hypothetical protein
MKQPPGFNTKHPNLVCHLQKAIYGLKQAPRAWFGKLASTLHSFGFISTKCDSSLFILRTAQSTTYFLIYVDDILITGSSPTMIQRLIDKLKSHFPLKDLGRLHYFLGIEAKQLEGGKLLLTQSKHVSDLLLRVNMQEAKGVKTPLPPSSKFPVDGTNNFSDPTLYRSIVGALQYATITRPHYTPRHQFCSQQTLPIHALSFRNSLEAC